MSLWKVAWRSIQQRALASALTAFSMGLGVALVVAVLVIYSVVEKSFRRGAQGYDLIVGAKGGKLELVLNTVFYLGAPVHNIPYDYYEEFTIGRFETAVEAAIPICMGHAYKGAPVVATVPEMFDKLKYLGEYKYEFLEGGNFTYDDHYGAVVGWEAARKTELKVGDTFQPVGVSPDGTADHEDEPFTIRGVLKYTGTPNDSAIFINMEGFFLCPAHTKPDSPAKRLLQLDKTAPGNPEKTGNVGADEDAPEAGSDDPSAQQVAEEHTGDPQQQSGHEKHAHHEHHKEVTAVLVCTDMERPQLAMNLAEVVNEGQDAQAVKPARVISNFLSSVVGNIELMLLVIAVLVVIVAGIGIMVSIYNSMSDRRHEIAVMRALGASRWIIMVVILMESILLSLGGGVLGVLLGHGLIGALSPTIYEETGVVVSALEFKWVELILIPGLIILATAVGYLPAVAAYQTDVAKSLTATQ